jgi:tetratricopeptide (TPR) repeat protein
MFRKTYFTFLLTVALSIAGASAVSAQNSGPVRGKVFMIKDGVKTPVEGAVIDAYRVDGNGKLPTKTNKKGEFQYAGFLLGQEYIIAVSGTGLQPQVYPKVKANMENLEIQVAAGDGKVLTEAEVKGMANKSIPAVGEQMSAAEKERMAAYEKEKQTVESSNKDIQKKNEIASRTAKEGADAFNTKQYDIAVAKYDEGIEAVPDFAGITPVLLNGKMASHRMRAFNLYVEGARNSDVTARLAKYEAAKKEYAEALKAYDRARTVLKNAPATTDANEIKGRTGVTKDLLINVMEVHRLMAVSGVETSKTAEAQAVWDEYLTAEADPLKKPKALKNLGDIYRGAGELEKAIAVYKQVLEIEPENQEVMAMIGLSLVGLGGSVDPPNKEQLQEGLNYMEKYANTVQVLPTDSQFDKDFKQSVKDTVEYLKNEQKLKPQTPPKAAPKRRG